MKRGFDILLSLGFLVILSPIILAIAAWIWAGDRGPVFYRQTRVGRGGETFGLFKFRTMVPDADKIGSWSTAEGDPRITKVGRLLRRTSLDELPQLLNVLRGEMSLVGPRPFVPAQEADHSPEDWRRRCSVRPGITGPSQVRSGEIDAGGRLFWDLDYVERHGVLRDLGVLWATAGRVIGLKNR